MTRQSDGTLREHEEQRYVEVPGRFAGHYLTVRLCHEHAPGFLYHSHLCDWRPHVTCAAGRSPFTTALTTSTARPIASAN